MAVDADDDDDEKRRGTRWKSECWEGKRNAATVWRNEKDASPGPGEMIWDPLGGEMVDHLRTEQI